MTPSAIRGWLRARRADEHRAEERIYLSTVFRLFEMEPFGDRPLMFSEDATEMVRPVIPRYLKPDQWRAIWYPEGLRRRPQRADRF